MLVIFIKKTNSEIEISDITMKNLKYIGQQIQSILY